MPRVADHRVGLPVDWQSWAHWRTAQKPRSPRRNIWVREWLVVFGQPVTFEWHGWPGWREWKFGRRCPEHVGYRNLEHGNGAR